MLELCITLSGNTQAYESISPKSSANDEKVAANEDDNFFTAVFFVGSKRVEWLYKYKNQQSPETGLISVPALYSTVQYCIYCALFTAASCVLLVGRPATMRICHHPVTRI